ncbi:MAG: lipocalin-like domain-containing protein [Chloroflexi bacterium]|nr:lipocalin-like domain-containing protein [Chloroflexota bacterium]
MNVVGTWRLTSFIVSNGAEEVQLFGPHPVGLLIFTEGGWFSLQIMQPDRPRFASNNRTMGADEEVRAAFAGYIAYFGTYIVDQTTAVIRLEPLGALYPNWLGETQIRLASMSGNVLRLTTQPQATARRQFTNQLSWEKVT